MADGFYSLTMLAYPHQFDDGYLGAHSNCCAACDLANEENQ